MNQTVNFLKELVAIPSPTGYTRDVQDYLIDVLTDMGYEPTRTAKGLVVVTVPGAMDEKTARRNSAYRYTWSDCSRSKTRWTLKLDRIGGFAWNMIEGENCTVHIASNGTTVSGTILLHQTSVHVYREAGTVERSQDNMESSFGCESDKRSRNACIRNRSRGTLFLLIHVLSSRQQDSSRAVS